MLRLSRKVGEKLMVGNGIFFTVLNVQGNTVQLGIEAPDGVPILREEIYLKVQKQQQTHRAQGLKEIALVDALRACLKTTPVRRLAY